MADIPQDIYGIIPVDHRIIIPYQRLIHFIHIRKGTILHRNDATMSQMHIGCKIDHSNHLLAYLNFWTVGPEVPQSDIT